MNFLYIVLLFFVSIALSAESSIDAQIQRIHNAPPKERVQMMNAFKIQLSKMNAGQRSEAILHLRSRLQNKKMDDANKNIHNHENIHDDMRNNSYQADNMDEIHGMERMNQKHGGDQYLNEQENSDVWILNSTHESTNIEDIPESTFIPEVEYENEFMRD